MADELEEAYHEAIVTLTQEQVDAIWTYIRACIAAEIMASANEMAEALQLADAALRGANMNLKVVERKVNAALAKATGAA